MRRPLTILDCLYNSYTSDKGQVDIATYLPTGVWFTRARGESYAEFKHRVEMRLNNMPITDAARLSAGG